MWKRVLLIAIFAWFLPISVAGAQDMKFGVSFGAFDQIDLTYLADNVIPSAVFPFGELHLEVNLSDHFSVRLNAVPLILINQLGADIIYRLEPIQNSFYLGAGIQGNLGVLPNVNFGLIPRVLTGYRINLYDGAQAFLEADAGCYFSLTNTNRFIVLSLYLGLMFPI